MANNLFCINSLKPSFTVSAVAAATVGLAKYGDYFLNTINKAQEAASTIDKAAGFMDSLLPFKSNSLTEFTSAYTGLLNNDKLNLGMKAVAGATAPAKFLVTYAAPLAGVAAGATIVAYGADWYYTKSLVEAQKNLAIAQYSYDLALDCQVAHDPLEYSTLDHSALELEKAHESIKNLQAKKYYSEKASSYSLEATKFFATLYLTDSAVNGAITGASKVVKLVQDSEHSKSQQIKDLQNSLERQSVESQQNMAIQQEHIKRLEQSLGEQNSVIQNQGQYINNLTQTAQQQEAIITNQQTLIEGNLSQIAQHTEQLHANGDSISGLSQIQTDMGSNFEALTQQNLSAQENLLSLQSIFAEQQNIKFLEHARYVDSRLEEAMQIPGMNQQQLNILQANQAQLASMLRQTNNMSSQANAASDAVKKQLESFLASKQLPEVQVKTISELVMKDAQSSGNVTSVKSILPSFKKIISGLKFVAKNATNAAMGHMIDMPVVGEEVVVKMTGDIGAEEIIPSLTDLTPHL